MKKDSAYFKNKEDFTLEDLVSILEYLRSPEGCPWDRAQTHESIKQCLIEEAYEVLETIENKDDGKFKDELGDLLLQIVFHSQIAKERESFDINDVLKNVCRKMIERHVHVFGQAQADNPQEALLNWEGVKRQEKGFKTYTQSLKDIPITLPALMRSLKVQKKAAMVGFDWDKVDDAMAKVKEECIELKQAYKSGVKEDVEEEVGDLLFAVVNVARFLKVEPEFALRGTIEKFVRRFEFIENQSKKPLDEMSLSEMDELWDKAKSENL